MELNNLMKRSLTGLCGMAALGMTFMLDITPAEAS
jgi:methane/ammonia monooxygenase subunit B